MRVLVGVPGETMISCGTARKQTRTISASLRTQSSVASSSSQSESMTVTPSASSGSTREDLAGHKRKRLTKGGKGDLVDEKGRLRAPRLCLALCGHLCVWIAAGWEQTHVCPAGFPFVGGEREGDGAVSF